MRARVQSLVLPFLLFLAAIQVIAASLWTPTSVAPDEDYHHNLALNVERQRNAPFWAPRDTPETAKLGVVSRNPSLFHQVFGAIAALRPQEVGTYPWLRAWNVLLTLGAIVLTWGVALRASEGDFRGATAVTILISSTPMWLFLGGMVHYDNLTNLLALAALGLTFAHLRSAQLASLCALAAVCAAGTLVKIVFLPLAFVFLSIAMVVSIVAARRRLQEAASWPQALGWPQGKRARVGVFLLGALALLLGLASAQLYGTNVVRYGRFTPVCNQVLGTQACEKNFTQFRVAQAREVENAGKPRLPLPFFVARYVGEIDKQWDDIHGYVYLRVRTPVWRTVAFWLAVLGGGVLAWRAGWRPWKDTLWATAFLVGFLYSVVLVAENWIGYQRQGAFGVAIHARYMYPVFVALAVVALLPVFRAPTSSRFRWAVLGLIVGSQFLRGPIDAWGGLHDKILTHAPGRAAPLKP